MTSPDQGGSGALITDHPFTPMKDHPEGCGFYPAKPHDPQGVTSGPCRWPRERHASGARSTVQHIRDQALTLGIMQQRDQLKAALEVARGEIAELKAAVREWYCENCNTTYPGPPKHGALGVFCPRCEAMTIPRQLYDLARAQSRIEVLERVAEAAKGMDSCQLVMGSACDHMRSLQQALAALDAAQATAEPTANDPKR